MTADANIVVAIKGRTDGAKKIKRSLDDVNASANKATKSTERLEKTTNKASKSFTGFKGAVSAAGVVLAGQAFIKAADTFTLLEARVKNSTNNVQEFENAMQSLTDIAAETGSQFSTTVEVFQRLSFVRSEIKASVDEMAQFTEGVQKLGVVSGASTQALNAGLTQLGQGLSSGVLRAEEFNSILENVPAIAVSIADEFGVTTGQLRQLVLEGEVLSSDVFNAILNQSEKINNQFEEMPKTVGRAFNELIIGLQVSVGEVNNVTGATDILVFALEKIGKTVNVLVDVFKGFASVISAAFDIVIFSIIDGFNDIARKIEKTINFAISGINKLKKEDIELLDFAPDISTEDLAKTAFDSAAKDFEKALDAFKGSAEGVGEIFTGTAKKSAKDYSKDLKEISKDYGSIAEGLTNVDEKANGASSTLNVVDEQFKKLRQSSENFANSAGDAFGQVVTGAKSAKEAVSDLLRTTASNIASQGFSGLIGGLLNGFGGGAGGGGGLIGAITGSFGGGAGGGIGSLFGFNSGGDMMLGGNSGVDNNVISLNGRAIANTSRGETMSIRPAGTSSNASGGVNVYQTINVSTGVQETVQAELVAFLPTIEKTTKAAIAQDKQRGITS